MTRGKKKQFPRPDEVSDHDPVAWRSSEDIIAIANEQNGWQYTNLAEAVRDWVLGHAISLGWQTVYFPLAYPSRTLRAGAVFVKK
jgi:hypothetical protein